MHTKTATQKEFTVLMALLISIVAISIDALLPALGIIRADLQVANPNHPQFLIGGLFVGLALGQLISGPLSDALGRKKVLYSGLALYLVGTAVCYFAPSFPVLLIGRIIQGLGVSGPYVSAVSIVRDKYVGRAMAQIMSLVMMIFMMVPAIAPSLGQAVMEFASWRAIFLMYMAYALFIAVWIYFRLEETLPPEKRVPFNPKNLIHGLREVARNKLTVCYTLCMGICFGSLMGYLNSSQQIFQEHFHTGKAFTLYFGGLALVLGVSSLVNARIVQRLGMRYISLRATGTVVIASILFLALHAFTPVTLWMFVGYASILFFCFGLIHGNLNAMAMEPMGHIAGLASAIIGASSSVLSMTIGGTIGQLYDNTLIPLTVSFVILFSIGWCILQYASKQTLKMAA